MEDIVCVNCGSELVKKDFDYNDGLIHYECDECGHRFTDSDILYCDECGKQMLSDEQIDTDVMSFCSNECFKKYLEKD